MVIENAILIFFSIIASLSTCLLLPKAISGHFMKLICHIYKSSYATIMYSIMGILSILLLFSFYDFYKSNTSSYTTQGNSERALVQAIDAANAKFNVIAILASIVLMAIMKALAIEMSLHQKLILNHEILQKQVKGMQDHFKNNPLATTSETKTDNKPDSEEMKKLKSENLELEDQCKKYEDLADKAKKDSSAILSQVQGYEREFDRLNEENKKLERLLAQYTENVSSTMTANINSYESKKDA